MERYVFFDIKKHKAKRAAEGQATYLLKGYGTNWRKTRSTITKFDETSYSYLGIFVNNQGEFYSVSGTVLTPYEGNKRHQFGGFKVTKEKVGR